MDYKNRPSNIIALGQLCSTSNIDHNFSQCEWLAERAKQSNAKMLCLPGMHSPCSAQSHTALTQ